MTDKNIPTGRVWAPTDLDGRYRDLLQREAKRAGTTVEELTRQGRAGSDVFLAAGARARRLGLNSVEDLFGQDRYLIAGSDYPGPECLELFEVEQLSAGNLSDARLEHAKSCAGCATLIQGLIPDDARQAELAAEVQRLGVELKSRPAKSERRPAWVPASPPVLVPSSWRNVRVPVGIPIAAAVIGSALATATAFAVVMVGYALWPYSGTLDQPPPIVEVTAPSSAVESARTLLQENMMRTTAASLMQWQDKGFYLRVDQPTVTVSGSAASGNVRYEAATAGVNDTLVAELTGDKAELYWLGSQPRTPSTLFAGKVAGVKTGVVTIENAEGQRDFTVSGQHRTLSLGEPVVVLTGTDQRRATDVLPMSNGWEGLSMMRAEAARPSGASAPVLVPPAAALPAAKASPPVR